MTAAGDRPRAAAAPLPHDLRVLIRGAVGVALILVVGRGIPAWRRWSADVMQRRTTAALERARAERLVAARKRTSQALDRSVTAYLALSQGFLKGRSPAEGAAALSALIADAAEANGVHLASMQPHADSASRTLLVPLTVSVSGTGDVRGIAGMLGSLESGTPLVEVRELTIAQPDPAAAGDHMEALRVELTIRALFRRTPGTEP